MKFYLPALLLALVLVILTFPENDWTFGPGIDPPLSWVFNHFFSEGLSSARGIIFPHGPLAFFLYPLPENILTAIAVSSFLKILIFLGLIRLHPGNKQIAIALSFFSALLICLFSGFTHLLLALIFILYLLHFNEKQSWWKYLAFLLTAFAFYVKSYVGIIAVIISFSFLVAGWYRNRKLVQAFIDGASLILFILIFYLVIFKTTTGFFNYLFGMMELGRDNSSAAAYYPENNWFLIGTFLLSLALIIWFNRTDKARLFFILTALPLFAAWKHGMARQDIYHMKGFFFFVLTLYVLFLCFNQKRRVINTVLSLTGILSLYLTLGYATNPEPLHIPVGGPTNFYAFVTDLEGLKEKNRMESGSNVQGKILPREVRELIGKNSVDVYPWDYSTIYVNRLNWVHRPVIQSYAAYTTWLDQQNSQHFNSVSAPEFLIWETDKYSEESPAEGMFSIDERYILNDEPLTVLSILKWYEPVFRNPGLIVVKRRKQPLITESEKIAEGELKWNEWLPLEDNPENLQRIKLEIGSTFLRKLKSFFFKDEQFWMWLRLSDGSIRRIRIVPKNAADGIWVRPLIFSAGDGKKDPQPDAILFTASNLSILPASIPFVLEQIIFESDYSVESFFEGEVDGVRENIFSAHMDFDEMKNTECGEGFFQSDPGVYSPSLKVSLDSLPEGMLEIRGSCILYPQNYLFDHSLHLVLSVDGPDGNTLWSGKSADMRLVDEDHANLIQASVLFNNVTPGSKLSLYFWNEGERRACIDNLQLWVRPAGHMTEKR